MDWVMLWRVALGVVSAAWLWTFLALLRARRRGARIAPRYGLADADADTLRTPRSDLLGDDADDSDTVVCDATEQLAKLREAPSAPAQKRVEGAVGPRRR